MSKLYDRWHESLKAGLLGVTGHQILGDWKRDIARLQAENARLWEVLEQVQREANELILQCESHDIKHAGRVFCRDCGLPDGEHKTNCAVGAMKKALADLEVPGDV